MKTKLILSVSILILLVGLISAGALELKPIEKAQQLDFSKDRFIVKEDGIYNQLNEKQRTLEQAEVWIDKKVGNTYHVDSLVPEPITIEIELFYEIQPDSIDYVSHTGAYQKTYTYDDWTWKESCSEDNNCSGGWVILEVEGIEYGLGSNTFASAISGATWEYDGTNITLVNGTDYDVTDTTFTLTNLNYAWNNITVNYYYDSEVIPQSKVDINNTITGLSSFGDYWEMIILAVVINIVLGLVLLAFNYKSTR